MSIQNEGYFKPFLSEHVIIMLNIVTKSCTYQQYLHYFY